MADVRVLEVKESVFADNDRKAQELRDRLRAQGMFLLNLMSSPGSGKTTTLTRTIEALRDELSIAVMEADIDSDVDARTIADAGVRAIQLHTGGMCHLDAYMTEQGLNGLLTQDNLRMGTVRMGTGSIGDARVQMGTGSIGDTGSAGTGTEAADAGTVPAVAGAAGAASVDAGTGPVGVAAAAHATSPAAHPASAAAPAVDLAILENVGNLVCPAEFDTGASANAMILSVPEGDDKPLKYPLMFSICDVVLINKIDALPVFDTFSMERVRANILARNPNATIIPISAKTGEGIDEWAAWLRSAVAAWKA